MVILLLPCIKRNRLHMKESGSVCIVSPIKVPVILSKWFNFTVYSIKQEHELGYSPFNKLGVDRANLIA